MQEEHREHGPKALCSELGEHRGDAEVREVHRQQVPRDVEVQEHPQALVVLKVSAATPQEPGCALEPWPHGQPEAAMARSEAGSEPWLCWPQAPVRC